MNRNWGIASAVAAVVLCVVGIIHAGSVSGTSAVVQSAPAQLDGESLRQMLTNMGLEPKTLSKGFLIAIKRDTWTFNMQLVVSTDKTKIGMNANLGGVENPDAVTAAQWKALMIANGNIDPSFFFFDAEQKKLYLHRSLDNRTLTPAYLREQIDLFVGNVKNTGDLWKFTK